MLGQQVDIFLPAALRCLCSYGKPALRLDKPDVLKTLCTSNHNIKQHFYVYAGACKVC
jgi:hypothetical protein